jgi:hypothetical protein
VPTSKKWAVVCGRNCNSPVAEIPSISIDEEVMFYDTDCGGVVHNIAYLRMIEKARTKLATLMGMALRDGN